MELCQYFCGFSFLEHCTRKSTTNAVLLPDTGPLFHTSLFVTYQSNHTELDALDVLDLLTSYTWSTMLSSYAAAQFLPLSLFVSATIKRICNAHCLVYNTVIHAKQITVLFPFAQSSWATSRFMFSIDFFLQLNNYHSLKYIFYDFLWYIQHFFYISFIERLD